MELESSSKFAPMKEDNQHSLGVKKMDRMEGIFDIVTVQTVDEDDENNTFIGVGKTRLTELQPYENCVRMVEEKDWQLIWGLITHMVENRALVDKARELVEAQGK